MGSKCLKYSFLYSAILTHKISVSQVIVNNLPNSTVETNVFDAVMVCNGHYNTPAIPNYPGRNIYKGQQIHSHDYRCPDPFKGSSFHFY